MTKYSKRKSLLLSSNDDIIERIPPMLEKHNNAVWMWQIEADYIDMYNEQLPADWLQVIDNNPHVSIEKCLGGYVLKHCNPDDVSIERRSVCTHTCRVVASETWGRQGLGRCLGVNMSRLRLLTNCA